MLFKPNNEVNQTSYNYTQGKNLIYATLHLINDPPHPHPHFKAKFPNFHNAILFLPFPNFKNLRKNLCPINSILPSPQLNKVTYCPGASKYLSEKNESTYYWRKTPNFLVTFIINRHRVMW